VVLLLLGVALRAAVLLPDGVMVPLPLPLPEGLGGEFGTLGCVSVSDSAACTVTSLPLQILLLLLLSGHATGPAILGLAAVTITLRDTCDRPALRILLPCISATAILVRQSGRVEKFRGSRETKAWFKLFDTEQIFSRQPHQLRSLALACKGVPAAGAQQRKERGHATAQYKPSS
jgi:hypothetical protein